MIFSGGELKTIIVNYLVLNFMIPTLCPHILQIDTHTNTNNFGFTSNYDIKHH